MHGDVEWKRRGVDGTRVVLLMGDNNTSRPKRGGCRRSQGWRVEPEDQGPVREAARRSSTTACSKWRTGGVQDSLKIRRQEGE
jgi:hypothetical protein